MHMQTCQKSSLLNYSNTPLYHLEERRELHHRTFHAVLVENAIRDLGQHKLLAQLQAALIQQQEIEILLN